MTDAKHTKDIKLEITAGVELKPTASPGISRAHAVNAAHRLALTWDRFLRIHNTAEAIKARVKPCETILDVGGFDGALSMFLQEYQIDVLDPITTKGTIFSISPGSYPVIVSIDTLEHVPPNERHSFLQKLCDTAQHHLFINFPGQQSAKAQQLVFELTNNPLVKEHVEWPLPNTAETQAVLSKAGFNTTVIQHTNISQWISQYLLQTLAPDEAAKANQLLIAQHLQDPVGTPLYDLIIGSKI